MINKILNEKLGFADSSVAWVEEINGNTVLFLEYFDDDISSTVEEVKFYTKREVEVSIASDVLNPKDGTWVKAHVLRIKN